MNKKAKNNWLPMLVQCAFGVLLGAACGMMIVGYLDAVVTPETSAGQDLMLYAALLLCLYLAYLLQLVIHEAGHLVFGLMTGYRFCSYRFLCFMWLRQEGKLRLRLLSVSGTAGQCLMAPPEPRQGRFPVMLYNLGGSIMNLIAAALFLAVGSLFGGGTLIGVFLRFLALTGLMCAFLNGIPMRTKLVDNDGRNAISLRKDPVARQMFWRQMKIAEQMTQGACLKDMPQEWFDLPPEADRHNVLVSTIAVMACQRLMEQQRFTEAEEEMARLLEPGVTLLGLHRQLLICDRTYCELIGENRKAVLDALRTKEQLAFLKATKRDLSVLRTEYAYTLLAERNMEKAKGLEARFDKLTKTYPYTGEVWRERELMRKACMLGSDQLSEPNT